MTHDQIISAYETYLAENESFETKNVKAAAARARKALGELGKLAKTRRAEIQERKVNLQNLIEPDFALNRASLPFQILNVLLSIIRDSILID